MSQAGLSIANAAGAIFRAALNAALGALVTNNSGATEPSPTYPNMWWYDTANAQLKRRNNANDAWIVLGLEAASTDGTFAANSDSLVPTQKAAKTYADTKIASSALDTDGTLAANSDAKVATQKAAKTYSDGKLSKTTAGEIAALTEKTALVDDDLFLIEDSAASNAKKKVKKLNAFTSYVPVYNATSVPKVTIQSASTERNTAVYQTYTKLKEITLFGSGAVTVTFQLKSSNGEPVRARVYKNGVAIGTEREASSQTYQTYSEDFSGLVNGDKLQIYAARWGASGQSYIKDFSVQGSTSTTDID